MSRQRRPSPKTLVAIRNRTFSLDRDAILRAGEPTFTEPLWKLFVNRTDDYAEQQEDGTYRRVGRALTRDDIDEHLKGSRTIGVYSINPQDQTVKWICWDIDTLDPENVKGAIKGIHDRIKAHQLRLEATLVEFSGSKGYHVWLLFEPPISAALAYHMGRRIAEEAGVQCEVFPKQAELLSPYGNLVKLPLAVHRKSGNRSYFASWDQLAPVSASEIFRVHPEFIMLTDELRKEIMHERRPWMEVAAGAIEFDPYKGDDPPCVENLFAQGRGIGSRRPVMHRLGAYLLNFKGMRLSPQIEEARLRLEAWNSLNSPPLQALEFESQWKSLLERPQYNYGCHDEWFTRNCNVSECPLMRSKMAILFGDFTPTEMVAGESLLRKDILNGFIDFTNQWVVRDEALRRNLLRTYTSALCADPINFAMFGRDSIGKTYNAVHVARTLDLKGKHIWYLGGVSPTSFVHDYSEYDKKRGAQIANLEGVTLLFLEPPHKETWVRLKPILSHDKDEIWFRITDRTKSGKLRTMKCIVKGWPAVVQCSAQTGHYSGEYSSRFLTSTPEISKNKTQEATGKVAMKFIKSSERMYPTPELRAWNALYNILSSMRPIRVCIPYALILHRHLIVRGPETTRVFDLFLRLIAANTALYCKQRNKNKDGEFIANIEDWKTVYADFANIVGLTFLGLSGDAHQVYQQIAGRKDLSFEDIAAAARAAFGGDTLDTTVRNLYIARLVETGFLKEKVDPQDKRRKLYDAVEKPPEISLFDDGAALLRDLEDFVAGKPATTLDGYAGDNSSPREM